MKRNCTNDFFRRHKLNDHIKQPARIGPGKRVNGKSGKSETTIFGHITRGSAGQLALTVLEGIMEGLRH